MKNILEIFRKLQSLIEAIPASEQQTAASLAACECYALAEEQIKLDGELLEACKLALGALDNLMGDSDLESDKSQEMVACKALGGAIFKAEGGR